MTPPPAPAPSIVTATGAPSARLSQNPYYMLGAGVAAVAVLAVIIVIAGHSGHTATSTEPYTSPDWPTPQTTTTTTDSWATTTSPTTTPWTTTTTPWTATSSAGPDSQSIAFTNAAVGDCVHREAGTPRADGTTDLPVLYLASCSQPEATDRVTMRTDDTANCAGQWVKSQDPHVVLCLEKLR